MDIRRRGVIVAGGLLGALTAVGSRAAEVLSTRPENVPEWNSAAFGAKTVEEALRALGVSDPHTVADLQIVAPEIAEDGAVVPVVVQSRLSGTREIHILVDKNPFSLAASFFLADGTEAAVSTRIKMQESSNVVALAVTGSGVVLARRPIKVTIGGCGG